MRKKIYGCDRQFGIYDFHPSHEQLLLRSSKNLTLEKNIDIIFYGVKFIQLPSHLDGVEVDLVDVKNHPRVLHETIYSLSKDNRVFEISNKSGEFYYVTCKLVRVYQNDQDFGQTSLGLASNDGRNDLIAEEG